MSFPVFLNVTDRLCLVVGGGAVGRRKARAVLAAGGRVRLVCLEPKPPDLEDPHLEWLREAYHRGHLAGAALVFAAAPPDVNGVVADDARQRGLWVNRADRSENGDFILPATLRRGDLTIAVGTGGASPSLAQEVRDLLERQFDDRFAQWVGLLAELRPLVLATVADAEQRRRLFERLSQLHWLEQLRREGVAAVRTRMQDEIEALAGDEPRPL